MYSLVQDETECRTVLGKMTYTERKIYGFSSKVLDVTMPESRLFGHVEYKLEIKATPHNSIDNEPRMFTFTTRFKEVSRLHTTLGTIHKQLFLKDKFPTFAEAKFFGTSDPAVIAERRSSIENFLQFVLNNETLCKSKAFQAFIENSKEELPANEESNGGQNTQTEGTEQLEQFLAATDTSKNEATKSTTDDLLMELPPAVEVEVKDERSHRSDLP